MTDNGQYNKKVANKLFEIAAKLDKASAKLDATAATLAHSIATMNSQQPVSPQLNLPRPRPLASTPPLNYRPISGESSIATLPRNATHEEQKAHAKHMSHNYEPGVEVLRDALDLAKRNSFPEDDTTYRDPKHNHSRSRLGGKKITNKTKKRTYKKSKKSYKKSKKSYKNKRSVKRGGVTSVQTYPVAFTISISHIPNIEEPRSFQIVLNSNQTGRDLIDEMNRLLDEDVIPLTNEEKKFPRKLVFPNGTQVKYDDRLEFYWSDTLILPLKNDDSLIAAAPVARAAAAPVARAAVARAVARAARAAAARAAPPDAPAAPPNAPPNAPAVVV